MIVPKVPVHRFGTVADYQNSGGIASSVKEVDCSLADLIRYSLYNGNYGKHCVWSLEGFRFYQSIPLFALSVHDAVSDLLMTRHCRYVMSRDYRYAEPSYKSAVSFYLGMVGARVVFDKLMGAVGCHLFHAGDSHQFRLSSSSGRRPDFVAVNSNGCPYALLEAKGTSAQAFANSRIVGAKSQLRLRSVTCVTQGRSGATIPAAQLEKRVVASRFKNDVITGKRFWELCDVDPDENGLVDLSVDLDGAMYSYYLPMLREISRGGSDRVDVNGVECEVVMIGEGVQVGLVRGLRDVISEKVEEHMASGNKWKYVLGKESYGCAERVFDFFRTCQGDVVASEGEKVSVGGDGFVVILSDQYIHSFREG